VDFSYEVSRALISACEGALLGYVDGIARRGKRRRFANTFLAAGHNLTILPVINKIDLPAAQPDFVKEQIETVLAIPGAEDALLISAKSGIGVEDDAGSDRRARSAAARGSAERIRCRR